MFKILNRRFLMNDAIIFGTGGHARVVFDVMKRQNQYNPVAFVSLGEDLSSFLNLPHVHQSKLNHLSWDRGVVAIGDNFIRSKVVQYILSVKPHFKFISLVDPSAQLGSDVVVQEGTVIMPHCVVNTGSRIGQHVILNTSSSIDHDCKIEDFASLAPGAILGGNVSLGNFTAVSLGAHIIHGKKIGQHSVIGAGAVVLKNVSDFTVAYGNPCREIRVRSAGDKYL